MSPGIFSSCVIDGSKQMVSNLHSQIGNFKLKGESDEP